MREKRLIDIYILEILNEYSSEKQKMLQKDILYYLDVNYNIKKVEADLRKQVIKCIKDNKIFEKLFKKEVITEELHKVSEGPDDLEAINDFKNFTTYFHGFFENRRNMYADEEKSTSVAYRIVNQNLPRYIDNIRIFKILMDTEICCVIPEMQRTYGEKLSTKRIEDFFSIDNYAKVVTNEEINLYNTIIGGFTTATNKKIKGLNEYINLYNQKNAKNKSMRKLPKLKPLYKQILADKEILSFIEEKFENDQEVIDTINIIINEIKNDILNSKSENSLINLMKNINEYDINKIYISNQ